MLRDTWIDDDPRVRAYKDGPRAGVIKEYMNAASMRPRGGVKRAQELCLRLQFDGPEDDV